MSWETFRIEILVTELRGESAKKLLPLIYVEITPALIPLPPNAISYISKGR